MKDSNIHVIELSEYTRPEITESKQRDWVNFGSDNNFPKYLIDRYINSPTNHTIINSVTAQIYGKGLDAFDKTQKPDEYAAMIQMFKKKDLKRLILDLKILGMGALQVTYKGKKVDQVTHFPMETLRPEKCNDKGEIEAWYYHPYWDKAKRNDKPTRIPVFGSGESNEIFILGRYISSMKYLSLPDWMGSAAYCELEENIADYLLNTVNNSFSASKLINFPNGTPSRDKMVEIKNDVVRKLTSQHGDKIIVSFSESKDTAPEVIDLPIQDAAQTYEYLSEECSRKIMIGHRVTSPLLIGLRDGNSGLGSNADEIINSSRLFTNVTIRPYQEQIIDCLDEIMAVNGLSLDMYFKTLEPLEFREADNVITQEQEESEELSLSSQKTCCSDVPFLSDEDGNQILEMIKDLGEDIDDMDEYEMVDVDRTEDEPEDFDVETYLNGINLSKYDSDPNKDSAQDSPRYKVRYRYVSGTNKKSIGSSREFCKAMLKLGKLYRKEDIAEMSFRGVNKSHGHKGQNYSLFRWAGGVNCTHVFERVVFRKRLKKDGTPWGGDALKGTDFVNVNQAVREGFKLPKNPPEVSEANSTRKDRGHHPNWKG
jgi:hypothetical protein